MRRAIEFASAVCRGTVIIPRVRLAAGPVGRALGLLGRSAVPPGEALLLRPCGAVHTFGMRFPIDVVFLDAHDRVVRIVRDLPPGRVARGGRGARAALELPVGWLAPEALAPGDQLTWVPESGGARSQGSPPPQS